MLKRFHWCLLGFIKALQSLLELKRVLIKLLGLKRSHWCSPGLTKDLLRFLEFTREQIVDFWGSVWLKRLTIRWKELKKLRTSFDEDLINSWRHSKFIDFLQCIIVSANLRLPHIAISQVFVTASYFYLSNIEKKSTQNAGLFIHSKDCYLSWSECLIEPIIYTAVWSQGDFVSE